MTATYDSTLLAQAIKKADEKALRLILLTICTQSTTIGNEAAKHLLVAEPQKKRKSGNDTIDKARITKKRKDKEPPSMISRFESCRTCYQTFDVTKNYEDSCQFHVGMSNLSSCIECSTYLL